MRVYRYKYNVCDGCFISLYDCPELMINDFKYKGITVSRASTKTGVGAGTYYEYIYLS